MYDLFGGELEKWNKGEGGSKMKKYQRYCRCCKDFK